MHRTPRTVLHNTAQNSSNKTGILPLSSSLLQKTTREKEVSRVKGTLWSVFTTFS